MTKISAGIMCIPKRYENASKIAYYLRHQGIETSISCDVVGGHLWENARRAFEKHSPTATHHLHIQDDVGLCKDFVEGLYKLVEARPRDAITLYMTSKATCEKARAADIHWIACHGVCWGPATLLPLHLLYQYLDWERAHVLSDYKSSDGRMEFWSYYTNTPVYAELPTFTEHLEPLTSSLGHPPMESKVSSWFIGDQSPLTIDWSDLRCLHLSNRNPKAYREKWVR